jgi:NADH dehydrogenase
MILVTGATGLVGRRLVTRLTAQGEVVCLIRPGPRVRQFEAGVSMQVVSADVDNLPALRLAMHGVHTIVHLAAISRPNRRHSIDAVNVGGTQNVIEAAQETGVKRIVYVSLIGADVHSAYPYLRSKGLAEEVIRESGLDYTIVRSSSVYGDGDDWTSAMAMGMHALPFIFPIPGDGRSRLQPIGADDLVECLSRSMYDRSKYNCTMEIGGPQVFTFNDIVMEIMRATGLKRRRYHMREPLARAFSRICERIMARPPFSEANIDLLSIDRTTTLDSVSYHFGFQPARFADSIGYLAQPRAWRRQFFDYLFTRN